MKYEDLEKLAIGGRLLLHKYQGIRYPRHKYIYKSKDINSDDFYKVDKVEIVWVQKYHYHCRSIDMPEYKSFKITKDDYKNLLKVGAKEEQNYESY